MSLQEELLEIPDIFPEKIDIMNRKFHCCHMSEKTYRESPFLDHRAVKVDDETVIVDIDEANQESSRRAMGETHYIFHNAFCCSTLFSRACNAYSKAHVLREPNIMLELASLYRFRGTQLMPVFDQALIDRMSHSISFMLNRKYPHQDTVIIKPTDAVNNLMGMLIEQNCNNKCLLMYSELERFLTAIFKIPQRAEYIKTRANGLCVDEMKESGQLVVQPQTLPSNRLAAMVWVLHMKKFRSLITKYGKDKVMVLDSEEFMRNKCETVLRYFRFIGIDTSDGDLEDEIMTITGTHSKDKNVTYTYEQREEEYQKKRAEFVRDIDDAVTWASSTFGDAMIAGL